MKTITTIDEAKAIKPGAYPVKGAVGVIFRKTADIPGVGAFNQRVSVGGGRRWISLGVLKRFAKLSEVQAKSRQVLAACDEGQNPFEARRTRKKRAHKAPVTFRQSTATYRVGYTPTLKGPYADKNWFNPIERHVFPALGDLLMSEIDGRDVAGVMNALDAKGLAKTALRLQGDIAPIFTLAMANGDRPLAMGNPADSALLKALRPGKYAADDEHYPQIEPHRRAIGDRSATGGAGGRWRHPARCRPRRVGLHGLLRFEALARRSKCNGRRSISKSGWRPSPRRG